MTEDHVTEDCEPKNQCWREGCLTEDCVTEDLGTEGCGNDRHTVL